MKELGLTSSKLIFIALLLSVISVCCGENVKKSVDEGTDDNGDANEEAKDETLELAVESETNNITCTRRQNNRMHAIQNAAPKQFPFMVALMSQLDDYLCSGAIISNGMILTTATCTTQPISYALLNTVKARLDKDSVVLHVIKTEKFPSFTGSESLKDVALVYTEKHNGSIASKIKLSNYTNPRDIVDIEAMGFGLNSDVGQIKELQYVGLESRSPYEIGNVMKAYIDCIETSVVTCFKDSGGPAIYNNELIGIVTAGQDECSKEITAAYAINKRMVTILPTYVFKSWLDDKMQKNEEKAPITLSFYPNKLVGTEKFRLRSAYAAGVSHVFPTKLTYFATLIFLFLINCPPY